MLYLETVNSVFMMLAEIVFVSGVVAQHCYKTLWETLKFDRITRP